jgi:hypothetical protein
MVAAPIKTRGILGLEKAAPNVTPAHQITGKSSFDDTGRRPIENLSAGLGVVAGEGRTAGGKSASVLPPFFGARIIFQLFA